MVGASEGLALPLGTTDEKRALTNWCINRMGERPRMESGGVKVLGVQRLNTWGLVASRCCCTCVADSRYSRPGGACLTFDQQPTGSFGAVGTCPIHPNSPATPPNAVSARCWRYATVAGPSSGDLSAHGVLSSDEFCDDSNGETSPVSVESERVDVAGDESLAKAPGIEIFSAGFSLSPRFVSRISNSCFTLSL